MENYVRKNGLVYNSDLHVLLAVDTDSSLFNGRVPFGVHEITDDLFSDCPYTSISLPDSVSKLGNCIFENSLRLERVKLPAQITTLPPYLFSGCTALTKVTMPNTVEDFSEGLFYNCSSMTEIPFRAGIKNLPENIFAGCTSLASVVIPDTVKNIGPGAFAGCTALESIVLPASLENLDSSAFDGCDKLRFIRISDDNAKFFTENGNLYERNGSENRVIIQINDNNTADSGNASILKNEEPEEVNQMGLWVNIEDEEDDDTDDIFSSEVGATDEEAAVTESELVPNKEAEIIPQEEPEPEVVSQEEPEVVSQEEPEVTPQEIPEPSKNEDNVSVSMDELVGLFSSSEPEIDEDAAIDQNFEKRLRILCQSVSYSRTDIFHPHGKPATLPDLFVIAENLSVDEAGQPCVSQKLLSCCKKLALFHDLKRIVYISGLDMENEEFLQFLHNFLYSQNILLACFAPSSASLSDYAKKICEYTGISLQKEDILEQRRKASIKNPSLIKLIIQDKMD